jgi:glycosyltransferase involved in cell wall biosynthesis
MRIAHVSDCYLPRLGGIERQVHDLALRQQQRGHSVQVITSVADPSGAATDVPVHRPAGVPGERPGSIRYRHAVTARAALEAADVDVVHLHASTWSPLTMLSAAHCVRSGIPAVVTVHSLLDGATPLFRGAGALLGWRAWPLAWSAVSERCAAPVRRVLGPAYEVTVLPNGVDAADWRLPFADRDPSRVVLVCVGRLVERKRPRQLLRILERVRAQVPARIAIEAVLVGDGPLRPRLQRWLDRHDMPWVRLMGAAGHDRIREVFRDADCYLAPARLESFGIAALEARCAGLPVVALLGTGIAEHVEHGRSGLLVADDAQLAAAVSGLIRAPDELARMRRHNATTGPSGDWAGVLARADELYAHAAELLGRDRTGMPALR